MFAILFCFADLAVSLRTSAEVQPPFLLVLSISFFMSFYLCLAYFYFILYLADVLQSGIWREANSLVDPSLCRLVPNSSIYSWSPRLLPPYRNTDLAG